jgi:antitoxin (DNA-binding transcriptional repressor) of toxin-antitoxin stability system
MSPFQTYSATEFKAKCLDILDRLATRELIQVKVTKRGKTVAILNPPEPEGDAARDLHGFMRGSVIIPSDLDLTEPVLDEPFSASLGETPA